MARVKILIVDDDDNILFAFREVIQREGYISIEARDGQEALKKIDAEQPQVIFLDISMPNLDGLETLRQVKAKNYMMPVIIITGQGTMQTAIKAMQLGAFEYLTKPLSLEIVRQAIQTALTSLRSSHLKEVRLETTIANRYEIIGNSAPMQEIFKLIGTISTTPNHTTILIVGESGTGKELVARAIHNNSAHSDNPFVAINCTAVPESLLESELFGFEKGAFTGAQERKIGKFEAARGGTIFLDEIGDLSPYLQQKLLRVLQEREYERLGGTNSISVGARFVAATNQNIEEKIKSGTFREDLFFRLNVIVIQLPPLREHKEDIPLLANYFLERYNQILNKTVQGFSDEVLDILQSYFFPGNVRELENLIERAVMLTRGKVILPEVFSDIFKKSSQISETLPIVGSSFNEARNHILNLFEKQFIIKQLSKYHGNVSAASRASNMSRQNFHRLLQKHNIQSGKYE